MYQNYCAYNWILIIVFVIKNSITIAITERRGFLKYAFVALKHACLALKCLFLLALIMCFVITKHSLFQNFQMYKKYGVKISSKCLPTN